MATDFASIPVVAGDDILASEYNTLRTDAIRRAGDYETAGGSSNAFTLSIDSSITSYVAGQVFCWQANHTIDGAATLNVNSIGAVSIVLPGGQSLQSYDIISGQEVTTRYDGTNMVLLSGTAFRPITNYFWSFPMLADTQNDPIFSISCGYSDDTTKVLSLNVSAADGPDPALWQFRVESDILGKHLSYTEHDTTTVGAGDLGNGGVYIDRTYWASEDDLTSSVIFKNGSSVTISGTARTGPLGHDPTNDYLLVLYSSSGTEYIERYSGIAGTTITNVDTITLDNNVTENDGFIFDDANSEFICIDESADVVRFFNTSGTQQRTVSFSSDITNIVGLTFVDDYLYGS
jgi:hypothetical protein